jgi:hypothetical protein
MDPGKRSVPCPVTRFFLHIGASEEKVATRDSSMLSVGTMSGALTGGHEHALNLEHEIREARLFLTKYFLSLWRHLTPA